MMETESILDTREPKGVTASRPPKGALQAEEKVLLDGASTTQERKIKETTERMSTSERTMLEKGNSGAVWGIWKALKVKQVPGHVNQERKCYYVLRPKSGCSLPLLP